MLVIQTSYCIFFVGRAIVYCKVIINIYIYLLDIFMHIKEKLKMFHTITNALFKGMHSLLILSYFPC